MLLYVLLHFHTYVMLLYVLWRFTHVWCYATVPSLAPPHIRHATLLRVLLRFHTYVMLRYCTIAFTCTHASCYPTVRSLALAQMLRLKFRFWPFSLPSCKTSTVASLAGARHQNLAGQLAISVKRVDSQWLTRCLYLEVQMIEEDWDGFLEIIMFCIMICLGQVLLNTILANH